jgi:hypothetical protein
MARDSTATWIAALTGRVRELDIVFSCGGTVKLSEPVRMRFRNDHELRIEREQAELHAVNVYTHGDHFVSHKDKEHAPRSRLLRHCRGLPSDSLSCAPRDVYVGPQMPMWAYHGGAWASFIRGRHTSPSTSSPARGVEEWIVAPRAAVHRRTGGRPDSDRAE